jgi:hypothetical protein
MDSNGRGGLDSGQTVSFFDREEVRSMRDPLEVFFDQEAQTTAEYALVILGAAAVAGALIAWAGGTDVIKSFFNKIFQQLMGGLG